MKYMQAAIPLPLVYPALIPAQAPNDEFTKLFATALFLVVRLETPSNVHHKGTDRKPCSREKNWKDL